MGKQKSENRIAAKKMWLDGKGKISLSEIAKKLGISIQQVSGWKRADKWQEEADRKQRGGQPQNKNAKGHGAPKKNKNAETHGAYSSIELEDMEQKVQSEINANSACQTVEQMRALLKNLYAKAKQLENLSIKYKAESDVGLMNIERKVIYPPKEEGEDRPEMEVRESSFSRYQKITEMQVKVQGRIDSTLRAIDAAETNRERLVIEARKLELKQQELMGMFDVPVPNDDDDNDDGDDGDDVQAPELEERPK